MSKPAVPKGTRDFLPAEMARRNYIFDTIRSVYRKFGFQPIETPAMEKTETLMGKYGEEGDRLIFRILNSGDYAAGITQDVWDSINKKHLEEIPSDNPQGTYALQTANQHALNQFSKMISEKALRYDLTVPFARFVVQHQHEITFPFKRYQIQPVWRADRPQKGRYREFYQCDADVVGSDSLLYEVEIVQMIHEVFRKLGVKVRIQMNNRKILKGLAIAFNAGDKATDLFVAMDKYEKIGDAIYDELREKGFGEDAIGELKRFIGVTSATAQGSPRLDAIRSFFSERNITEGIKGVEELEMVFNTSLALYAEDSIPNLEIDVALARGLNYYTGAIFEVKADEGEFQSSICGGGRYDDLTGIFGLKGVSGVGISFGADRIYDVLLELNRFPEMSADSTQVLIVNFGEHQAQLMKIASDLRGEGFNVEVYPDAAKMKKQFGYADSNGIPYVVIMGEDEQARGVVQLKNMKSGDQREVSATQLADAIIG